MKTRKVRDLMVPMHEYATVSEDASLFEAVMALEEAQEAQDRTHRKYLHRAILVFNKENKIVGKVGQHDILKALEPKYQEILETGSAARFGFSVKFQKSILEQYSLWNEPLNELCKKATNIVVRDFMHRPEEGEYIKAEATLNEAIHLLVMGKHQSLLVTDDINIIGILRLTDVFMAVFEAIAECHIESK